MKYYAVAEMRLLHRAWVPAYVENVTKLVEAFGGRYLARTSSIEQIEGDRESPHVFLLIEWPSREAALTFYVSPDYAPYRKARLEGAQNHFWLIAGKDDTREAQVP
jgi:uncharacterized protein (DUF1330 family)